MGTLIGLVILLCVLFLPGSIRDYKFSNRTSPNGYKTDWNSMTNDLVNGESQESIKQKFNRGFYDIPDKK